MATPTVLVVLWSEEIIEFTDAFLWFCVAESSVAALGSFYMEYSRKNCNCSSCKSWCQLNCQECNWGCFKRACCFCIKLLINKMVHKVLFSLTIVTLQVLALVIFFDKETTDKGKSPEKSRDLNRECVFLEFFDYYDIWHILSSFGLLMGALMVIHVSYESPKLIKKESRTQATEGVTIELQSTAEISPETEGCCSPNPPAASPVKTPA